MKGALFQGGITAETLDLLISGEQGNDCRNDSDLDSMNPRAQDYPPQPSVGLKSVGLQSSIQNSAPTSFHRVPRASGLPSNGYYGGSVNASFFTNHAHQPQSHLRIPSLQRQTSYGISSVQDNAAFDDEDEFNDGATVDLNSLSSTNERRTIFFNGLSDRTTYRDLLSVIKGGKLLSINMRSERSALVTFYEGAADFLAWTKKNDIYLNAKRVC